ncbi:hydantoinase/oxoprolinase family protein [Haloglomus halophilum]|uniref:hydantoinase/oxoprolinase family protein n=1 Tax=Haloglomus halophilum TaxID=2962672 RepID=UPI0020CA140F|nr:hydantoinase/oxoprolinase family protein [Haloglomus halophilum]
MGDSDTATRVGIDVGGTFTDVVAVTDGRVRVHKVASTPDAPEQGVVEGLSEAADEGLPLQAVDALAHGTTVATNAVLERDWADTALLTTEGFRDVLEIGRQDRPDLYDLHGEKPDPVVPRDRRYEVPGRLDERGTELAPLDEETVRDLPTDIDAESVAVALLFAFEDDSHERRVRRALRDGGYEGAISLSSEVLPEIREYERTLATALNATLRPVLDRYLGRLDGRAREAGVGADLRVMASNGGLMDADTARETPVRTLLSGPAAGVRGAAHVAARHGHDDVLTMDMGGTSCDVSLVRDGEPLVSTDVTVGEYPVATPMVDVHTVGSGGGSIARVDEGGALRVGPASAGAEPGPVCYGRGGDEPTVTDAAFALGRIAPSAFLGDIGGAGDATRQAIERAVGEPLDADVREAAAGILSVAEADTARALRVVSVERGYDPRDLALVAFGGAGPLIASAVASELSVPEVVVPRAAGVLSALGLLVSDRTYDESVSRVRAWREVDAADLEALFADLESRGRERLADVPADRRRMERAFDLRYRGQTYDLTVDAPADLDGDALDAVAERFHEAHRQRYGHASPDEPLELVTVRLRARGVVDPPELDPPRTEGAVADAVREERPVTFDGRTLEVRVYDRSRLPTGGRVEGPAVVEGAESTLVVRPPDRVRVADDGSLVVEVDADV